jgi:hypothetical protein
MPQILLVFCNLLPGKRASVFPEMNGVRPKKRRRV